MSTAVAPPGFPPGLTQAQYAAMMAQALEALHQFKVEAFTLLSIAVIFVILRTISRLIGVGFKRLQLDDYLMIFAIILYGIETGAAYIVGEWYMGLANNGMTPEERARLDPNSLEWSMRVKGSKVQVIGWNLYTLLLWTLKMCMCIFYARLTNGLDHFIVRIRIGYGAIVATYIAVMLSILCTCHPLRKNWQIDPDPGVLCQPAISPVNCLVTVVLNVLTDVYLMSIPLPLMWKTQMPLRRKALLMFMFSGAIFIIGCGILRCTLILVDPLHGAQKAGSWAVRETFVSVIIGNIPMVYQLFRRIFRKAKDKVETSRSRSHGHIVFSEDAESKPGRFQSYGFGSKPTSQVSRKSRFRNPLSLDNTVMENDSEEALHLDAIKKEQCVVTTEFSVEVETTSTPSSDDLDRKKTGWVGERS